MSRSFAASHTVAEWVHSSHNADVGIRRFGKMPAEASDCQSWSVAAWVAGRTCSVATWWATPGLFVSMPRARPRPALKLWRGPAVIDTRQDILIRRTWLQS
jgi:hypothetical protein